MIKVKNSHTFVKLFFSVHCLFTWALLLYLAFFLFLFVFFLSFSHCWVQYLDTLTAHTHTHTHIHSGPSVLSGSARSPLLSQSFYFSFSLCSSVNYTYHCLISQYYCALSCIHDLWPLFITARAGLTCGADQGHNFHHHFALHLVSGPPPGASLSHTLTSQPESVFLNVCLCVCELVVTFFWSASDMRSLASTKLVQTSHCDDVREWLMHDKT